VKFIVGELANHLSRLNVVLTATPLFEAKFPAANLKDGVVEKYGKWRKGATTYEGNDNDVPRILKANLCLLKNGGAELGASGWKRRGTVTVTTAQKNTGLRSFQVAASGSGYYYQDVTVRSGEWLKLGFFTRGNGTTATASVSVRDLKTNRWLQDNGTFGTFDDTDAEVFLGENLTAAWVGTAIEFRAEPFTVTQTHLTILRVFLRVTGSGNGHIDDVCIYPATSWCSVHGVGFPANMVPTVWSSDTGLFAGEEVLRMTMAPKPRSFFTALDAVFFAKHLKFELPIVGDATFQPWIGELVFGQYETLIVSAQWGSTLSEGWPAVTGKAVARKTRLKTSIRATRTLNLDFIYAEKRYPGSYAQALEWFIERCRGETEDIIFSPDEMDAGRAVYGGLAGPRGHTAVYVDARQAITLQIVEDAFPRIT
jgi:hypothetical protein